jgi:hypothetical protein
MAGSIDRLQAHEDDHGYVRAFLALARTQDGGRRPWIASGYRSCWDVWAVTQLQDRRHGM